MEQPPPPLGEEAALQVYHELRSLARQLLAGERAEHTLQPTALVHEAYLRCHGREMPSAWANPREFFGAAAVMMRRVLVDSARRRQAQKRGGGAARDVADPDLLAADNPGADVAAVADALDKLRGVDPEAAEVVELRYFVGLTLGEVAAALKTAPRTVDRLWAYARAFLKRELDDS